MKPERWQQVNELFQAALEREPGERARFVAEACADDELLRSEVESLIAFHDKGGSFMERPAVAGVAANLLSDEQDQLEVGQTLGHYQILDSLGAGGMGEVYLARDTNLGRKIALKLLPAYLSRDKDRLRRFEQEARVASTISHPNVAHIYEIGEANGHRFITMEYVEGVTLRQHTAQKELKLDRVFNIATQVADALGAAHMAGIVHRDIKPENIMVRPDGYIKVLDFGLAKIFQQAQEVESEAETEARFSTPGAILGTVPYMSPEQVRGEAVDGRSDIFSFGVVLYEMLSGRQPFASPSPAATVSAILTHEPPPLARYAADVPEELQRITRKCLEKDRERRYQSARDLAIDLENIRRESSESARVRLSSEERSPVKTEFPEVAGAAKRPGLLASRRAIMAATVLLAVVAAGIVYLLLFRRAPEASAAQINSLAVLPLENLSGDPEQEYFADGMTEALTTELAKIGALRVISRTSVMQYKRARKPLPEIARALNVDAVVEGSVIRSGGRVKITAQLIRAATNEHLWAQSYERDLSDILALQDEVARGIANEIKIKLTPQEQMHLANARQVNPEAQEAYLKGRYYLGKTGPEDVRKATDYFQQAILKDPNYAQAYAALADCYIILGDTYLAPSETMPKAKEASIKALELEETLAEGHNSLAGVRFLYDWDWVAAETECRRAIELNPNNAQAHFRYANYLAAMGRHQESIAESKRAQDLDPLSLRTTANLAWDLFLARQYDEAIGQSWKVIDMEPNFWRAHMYLGLAYEQKGKFPEAAAELEKARQLSDSPLVLAMLGGVYAVSGRRAEAMRVLEELKDQSKRRFVCPYETATVYVGLGETEEAFKWLEQGYRDRSRCMVWLKVDPRLDSVRSDPRFADLMRRVGLTP